jgi:error-prone DNA polymerase
MKNSGTTPAYAPLGFRSYLSLLRGVLSPEEICERAARMGFGAVGLTDINNLYALPRFLAAARRHGLKPVVGARVGAQKGAQVGRDGGRGGPRGGGGGEKAFTAYVLNRAGFARLCGMLTRLLVEQSMKLYFHEEKEPPYDPLADLLENGWQGLAVAAEHDEVLDALARRGDGDLYVRLTLGRGFMGRVRRARGLGLPLLAVNTAVFSGPDGEYAHNVLRAVDLNCNLVSLPPRERAVPEMRAAEPGEMERFFAAVPEALENTLRLAGQSDPSGLEGGDCVFPGFREQTPEQSFALLKKLCLRGAAGRYGKLTPEIGERLDYELSIIREKGFAAYFLVVNDIVSRCPRTCGRGSSAASIVSYLLGITHVDPLRYNLFFERFLNRGRTDPPDIDVDFPWDERDKALAYVFERYRGRAGMVADHVTFARRSSIREPAKAFGMEDREIERMVRLYLSGEHERIPPYLLRTAELIRGMPRHLGTHPGGVVITPGPLTAYTHAQVSQLGYPVIAWEKDGTELMGLVKIDLLGNRSLGVLRDTIRLVNERHNRHISWRRFNPLNDRSARALIERGDTLGVFYIESPATRQLLKKMGQADFERLVIASSIIRPAANRYIEQFVRRLHGEPYKPLHPLVEQTLKDTFGIMVYQEDVSRVAIDIAGFSASRADRLRKILSKKFGAPALQSFKQEFSGGARARGVDRETIEQVWAMILSFDGYSFCKAHSASYAMVSYRLACLKHYYPLEFMVSVINNGGGFYSRQTYVNHCRRMGYRLLGPDVNKSEMRYTPEPGAVRVGLMQLCNIRGGFLEDVIEERRRNGPYADFTDFVRRARPGLPEIGVLIRSGALDGIKGAYFRPQLFWLYFRQEKDEGLFFPPPIPAFIRDYPPRVKLKHEVETLGLIVSAHPLAVFAPRIAAMKKRGGLPPFITSRQLAGNRGRNVTIPGVLVTGKEVRTRSRRRMMFVSFEDEYSIFETVLFPGAYTRYAGLLYDAGVFLVTGRVEEDLGALSVHVERLVPLTRDPESREAVA